MVNSFASCTLRDRRLMGADHRWSFACDGRQMAGVNSRCMQSAQFANAFLLVKLTVTLSLLNCLLLFGDHSNANEAESTTLNVCLVSYQFFHQSARVC